MRQLFIHDGADEVHEKWAACLSATNYIPDDKRLRYELCVADVEQKLSAIRSNEGWGESVERVLPNYIQKVVSRINRQMSRQRDEQSEKECIARLRYIVCSIEGIETIAKDNIAIRALIEYEAILRNNMWGNFRAYADYAQMALNWQDFMAKHPDCISFYHENYARFRNNMEKFHKEMNA